MNEEELVIEYSIKKNEADPVQCSIIVISDFFTFEYRSYVLNTSNLEVIAEINKRMDFLKKEGFYINGVNFKEFLENCESIKFIRKNNQ